MSSNKNAHITGLQPADDFDELEVCTDTDQGATCSNYSDRAEFTANSEDSEDSSIPIKRSLAARKHTPVVKPKGKETSEDTPVTSHRGNQDNDNTVENVEISQTSNHTHSKSRKVKVASMRGKESQEPPVTVESEESNDEIENVAGTSTATRGLQRSHSKKNRENVVAKAQRVLKAKRKNREERDTSYVNTRDQLEYGRNRITSPSQVEDDDEITQLPLDVLTPRKKNYVRKHPSVVWRHVDKMKSKRRNIELVQCKYCDKEWEAFHLGGSTSNMLKHLRVQHYHKLTAQDIADMPQNGTSSGSRGQPPRTLNKKEVDGQAMPRTAKLCKEMDRKLAKFFISSTCSWVLLENKNFANLFTDLYEGRYNLPSRSYLQTNVITPMYEETKLAIKEDLRKYTNIAVTTDAWTSMTQQSYITVTAHVIDETKCELKFYVLSTSEITKRHTSVNLMDHIDRVLQDYNIAKHEYNITCNFNAINLNDIHEEDKESDNEENHLNEKDSDLDEEVVLVRHQSQPSCNSKTHDMLNVEKQGKTKKVVREVLKHKKQASDVDVAVDLNDDDDEGPHITFITDNASDIGKAIKTIGGFPWFGCAGHHLNLVAQEGFKKVEAASKLVKKCKRIVEYIKSSVPASYMLVDFQQDLEMPILKLLQENNTRWWSILIMMTRIKDNMHPLMLTIAESRNRFHLILTEDEQDAISDIIDLFEPFKEAAEKLGAEKQVSISLVLPVIHYLKAHLEENVEDISMIRNMKIVMLEKLESRYSREQIKVLQICTLLDVRFKNDKCVINDYDLLTDQVKKIDAEERQHENQISQQENQVSQNENLVTVGQEINTRRTKKKRLIFQYEDDVVPQETGDELYDNAVYIEVGHYQKITMTGEEKEKTDVLTWWRNNRKLFPKLFKLVKVYLHIPATSVPSERIFSLAGYMLSSSIGHLLFGSKGNAHKENSIFGLSV